MILVLDCNYLCFRAYWTTGRQLENGTVYGFLSTLQSLRAKFAPDRIVFCFDGGGTNLRRIEYPEYKRGKVRKDGWDEDRENVHYQIVKLQSNILPALGFRNVFWRNGYEADDVIASICKTEFSRYQGDGLDGPIIIVSADHDLYQLLEDDRIRMYEPSKDLLLDAAGFREQWGIEPRLWPNVKALAGCRSDNIPGVGGVGEKTAAKYLARSDVASERIYKVRMKVRDKIDLVKFNLRLVRLPWAGIGDFQIKEDEATGGRWREWCERNKMLSLIRERKSQWTPSKQSATSSVRKRKGGTPSMSPSSQ